MYKISNEYFYKLYDAEYNEITDYFYSDDEIINFIARWFHDDFWGITYNSFLEQCTCDIKDLFKQGDCYYRRYMFYDNYNRIINARDFKEKAFDLYKKWKVDGSSLKKCYWENIHWKYRYKFKIHNKKKYEYLSKRKTMFEYRKDPVPFVHKWRGGSSQSGPGTARIIRMFANPDYKEFNRGSRHGIPQWWDDRSRCVQRSWKEQSKAKHQWERRNNFLDNVI